MDDHLRSYVQSRELCAQRDLVFRMIQDGALSPEDWDRYLEVKADQIRQDMQEWRAAYEV